MKKFFVSAIIFALISSLFSGCTAVKESFEITMVGEGRSDCSVIKLDDTVIVADTSGTQNKEAVESAVSKYGNKIDMLILSRYDKEALGNAAYLVDKYSIKTVFGPRRESDIAEYTAFREALEKKDTQYVQVEKDYLYETKNGFLSINPAVDLRQENVAENDSLITTIMYKGYYFLFAGNAGEMRMDEFLELAREEYDLVRLPYGWEMSRQLRHFLTSTDPEGVVIPANDISEIPDSLMKKLEKDDIQTFYTYDGNIVVTCDEKGVAVTQNDLTYYPAEYETVEIEDEAEDELKDTIEDLID